MLQQLRAILLTTICLSFSPGVAEELPEDFDIITIPNKSDDSLNRARLVCAANEMPSANRVAVEYGLLDWDIPSYCAAILTEIITRNLGLHLYVRMQGNEAVEELNRIFEAASENQTKYQNMVGVTKTLHCSLAYDAGRVYESIKPRELDLPTASATTLKELRTRCFAENGNTPAINGLIVGVLDQRILTATN